MIKINLAKSAGFCFGVKRALRIAREAMHKERRVFMLGDIVHNEKVVEEIRQAGIKKLKHPGKGKNKTLLIRAHGAPGKIYTQARKQGYKIIDATCPMVKEIHRIVRGAERKKYTIIVIGDKKHDEVQGIVGQLKNKAIVIDNIKDAPLEIIKKIPKACVVVQSTQNLRKVLAIVEKLKCYIPQLKFFNTICNPTRTKQNEIRKMSRENDIILIIGSKESANTRRLYELSKKLNKHTYWIQAPQDIKKYWFKNIRYVGVSAGASTPDKTIQEIITKLMA